MMQKTSNTTFKLQKVIADAGLTSRRKAEVLIEQGRVMVNGQKAKIGQRVNPNVDEIIVNNEKLNLQSEKVYYLVNKPVGFVSTTSDELNRKTVLDLIPKIQERIYPVGRLDKDSEGLMLLTNDGDLAFKLTHPSKHIKKTYHVLLQGTPSTKALNHLERGVKLKDGYAKPDDMQILAHEGGNTWLELSISEGRNRQVRRMMDRIGYTVLRLIRTEMGPFSLDQLDHSKYLEVTKPVFHQDLQ